jgi:hypothetical protein
MLSTEQKKLKEKTIIANVIKSSNMSFHVRPLLAGFDIPRVTELWANLSMIQQMQGNDYWNKTCQDSKLSWAEFMKKTITKRSFRVIVLENDEMIFGFAYMSLSTVNANNPKQKNQLKATIKEVYLEPAYRPKVDFDELGVLMQNCLITMGVDLVEIDVKNYN